MKFWKVAVLVALATVPLLIIGKKMAQDREIKPEAGDANDIFEHELTAD